LKEFNHVYDKELRSNVIGKGEHEGAGIILKAKQLSITPEQFLAKRNVLLSELFLKVQPKPGAIKITHHFKNKKIPIALATSSYKHLLDKKFHSNPEWLTIFDFVITGDSVERAKPDPDIFIKAAKGLNLEPSQCLVFEDSPAGAESGRKAGCTVVAVPDPSIERSRYDAWAHIILESLLDFNPDHFGLPNY